MASKEAKSGEASAPAATKAKKETFAFEFKLAKADIGEKTTNPQIKSKVNESFMGYGAFDECRVTGGIGEDRTVHVFFARLFGKGQPAWEALVKGEKPTIKIYDKDIELTATDAEPSGGGATSGTAHRPKKESGDGKKKAPKKEGGRGRGGEGEVKDGEKKEGGDAKKEGGRGRGRGKKEEAKTSLQRGRANIGGKLGPVSKVRQAKLEKAKRDKENEERKERGEAPLEDPKKAEEPEEKKEEKGKKDAGKKEGGKKEGGKAEAGKKDAGKKEAGKADAGKKEGAKKGK